MEMNPFLEKEYSTCMEQLRFYDTRHNELLKYLVSLTSAVATASFALFQYLTAKSAYYFALQAILSGVVFIGGLLLFFAMTENRLYFIRVARQINSIRNYCLKTIAKKFEKENQLWRNKAMPAFRFGSIHTYQLIGAAMINAIFLCICIYSIFKSLCREVAVWLIFLLGIIMIIIEIFWSARHLTREGRRSLK